MNNDTSRDALTGTPHEDSTRKKVTRPNIEGEPTEFFESEIAIMKAALRKLAANPMVFDETLDRYRKAAQNGTTVNSDGEKDRLSKSVADDGSDFKMSHNLFPVIIRHLAHVHPEIVPAMNITKSFADKMYPDVRRAYAALHKGE